MDIYTLAKGMDIIFAKGPSNPANKSLSYLIERPSERCPIFINVIEAYRPDSVISSVEIEKTDNSVEVTVKEKTGTIRNLSIRI